MNEQLKKRILKNGYYTCNRMNMYKMLKKKGHEFLCEGEDRKNTKFKVWIFKATPELLEDVEAWIDEVNESKIKRFRK